MQFKNYSKGNLEFVQIDSKINRTNVSNPMFLFNDKYYKSEYLAIEYFKSIGYDAFFSENTTWKNLLKTLFKDIFKKFKKFAEKKQYKKKDFYDNEFFKEYEDEINAKFEYLKKIDLWEEVNGHSMREWIKYRILKICENLEKDKILAVLYDMIQDYAHNHIGFPDLFVFNKISCFFL